MRVPDDELKEINDDLDSNFTETGKLRETSTYRQFVLLNERNWALVIRNPIALNFLIVLAVYNSLLWGGIFYQVDA